MKFSKRITDMPASPIRKLVPFADEAKRQGKTVYHVNIGQPDVKTPPIVMDTVRSLPLEIIAYGPAQGLTAYRKALPAYYLKKGISVAWEHIFVTTAGSEALLFALMAVCDPGDEVIIPEPYYANINGFAQMAGVQIRPIRTYIDDGFSLPETSAFEELITEKTKAILICNPNNPTGAVYSEEKLQELGDLVKRRNLFLMVDEVYREFIYDGLKTVSALNLTGYEEHIIVADSISKRYSACGARVGALISRNERFLQQVLKMAQARLCPPTIEQMAAEAATKLEASYYDEILAEYDRRREVLYQGLKKIPGVFCTKPQGAFYIIVRLPVDNAEKFAEFMLKDFSLNNETIMFSPAEGFYKTEGAGKDEIRIAYVIGEKKLIRVLEILEVGLEEYQRLSSGVNNELSRPDGVYGVSNS